MHGRGGADIDSITDRRRDGAATDALDRVATGAAFLAVAARRSGAVALRWDLDTDPQSMTYGELARRARAVAHRILTELEPGDRLAIWSANTPEWIVAQLGAALAGVVLVPMNPALTEHEARFILASSGARSVLTGPVWRDRDLTGSAVKIAGPELSVHPLVEWTRITGEEADGGELPDVSPDDVLLIQYTSGTTGTPKGAMLSHLIGTNVGPHSHGAMGLTEDDVVCSPLPFHHVGGSVCTALAALLRGATYVLLPGFDADQTLTTLERAEVTFFGGVPTMLIAILEKYGGAPPPLPHLRLMMVGGTTVSPSLITTIEQAFGVDILNGYGQSEAPSALQTRPGDTAVVKAMTIGRPNPGRELAIVDTAGVPVVPGTVGELCLRGELIMSGYWEERDRSRSAAIDDAGWLHTGDLASQDGDGVVTLHGRLRDVIIRGGENIYPAEVEAVLATHEGIADVAVVGAPDPHWGEVPVAFVRWAGPPIDPAALEAFARERLAGFKVPREWRPVSEFPLTASGKVQKFRLAEQLAD